MKITCIDSGSHGNCFCVESDKGTGVFLDAGCSYKQISQYNITVAGKPFFVTHEHGDHSKYAHELEHKYGADIVATKGTTEELGIGIDLPNKGTYYASMKRGADYDVEVTLIPVVHNAVDPCCFYLEIDGESILYITDTGTIPEVCHLRPDVLIIEANYTAGRLHSNAMQSESVMQGLDRINSKEGHLSAYQAAKTAYIMRDSLDLLIFCHISKRNFDLSEFYNNRMIPEIIKNKAEFAYAGAKWNTIPF